MSIPDEVFTLIREALPDDVVLYDTMDELPTDAAELPGMYVVFQPDLGLPVSGNVSDTVTMTRYTWLVTSVAVGPAARQSSQWIATKVRDALIGVRLRPGGQKVRCTNSEQARKDEQVASRRAVYCVDRYQVLT